MNMAFDKAQDAILQCSWSLGELSEHLTTVPESLKHDLRKIEISLGLLPRGEQAAAALENNLSNLEGRLDAILAALEAKEAPQSSTTATAAMAEPSTKATGAADGKLQGGSGSDDAAKDKKDTA
ncbi:hypothetical protein FSARC_4486 [Fusarium sarcochroum]|uniref:Uncharacterized protein n=1 Tax=Fusarium sarcochroum TaxID=1208366 RepID=A0A8H4U1J7_9HYPO|nr:hypothetical protein FSARC_4486 [Fusarium sarcochroum]